MKNRRKVLKNCANTVMWHVRPSWVLCLYRHHPQNSTPYLIHSLTWSSFSSCPYVAVYVPCVSLVVSPSSHRRAASPDVAGTTTAFVIHVIIIIINANYKSCFASRLTLALSTNYLLSHSWLVWYCVWLHLFVCLFIRSITRKQMTPKCSNLV